MTLASISEHELSRRTKIKQPIIHRLLTGENTNPKLLTLKPIADYFMLSVSQLIGEQELESIWKGYTSKTHAGWVSVPLINYDHIKKISEKSHTKSVITECQVSQEAFAFYICDQSMEPIFPEKSIVIVEPDIEHENGDYILIKNGMGEFFLRNFLLISGLKYISPLNHKFGTIDTLRKGDTILGTVVRTIYDHKTLPTMES